MQGPCVLILSTRFKNIAGKFKDGGLEIIILLLPVGHPELNPIKMVCGFLKRARNLHFYFPHVESETQNWIQKL